MNKIVFIVPKSKSPCGIYDYTINVINEAQKKYDNVDRIVIVPGFFFWLKLLMKCNDDVMVMQYPALVYRRSLFPAIYAMFSKFFSRKLITILHENSEASRLRKLINKIILHSSYKIVVTNKAEYEYLPVGEVRNKANIISIGSNTVGISPLPECKSLNNRVAFFGLVRKDKGIEEFIELIDSDRQKEFKYIFVGGTTEVDPVYTSKVIDFLNARGVELHLNEELNIIHQVLCSCTYTYLIYPDGASERRGSLLASLKAGCIVFSNDDRQTSEPIRQVINYPTLAEMRKIHKLSARVKRDLIGKSLAVNELYSWNKIAKEIIDLATCNDG
ncbi:glycosyltransferase family protein [Aeromonas caviae]|uniref:hypothetical protein n=1 Tax=Aeromonas caviae TaxID=648 RepID=UPI0039893737